MAATGTHRTEMYFTRAAITRIREISRIKLHKPIPQTMPPSIICCMCCHIRGIEVEQKQPLARDGHLAAHLAQLAHRIARVPKPMPSIRAPLHETNLAAPKL